MSARNLPGGKRRLALKADNLTATSEPIVLRMWEPRRLTTLWASTACYRDSFTYICGHEWCKYLDMRICTASVIGCFMNVELFMK
jgi:hypothetical protein